MTAPNTKSELSQTWSHGDLQGQLSPEAIIRKPGNAGKQGSFVDESCKISGSVRFEGISKIEGTIEGEIHSTGELTISPSAKIDAKIFGELVKVYGAVKGEINTTNRLELYAGAKVEGNIASPSLVIEEGVTFHGNCRMESQSGKKSKLVKESNS